MYAYIQGILTFSQPDHVIIDVHGVGYQIYIPSSLHGTLPQTGSTMLLYTYYVVREQSQTLYGFLTVQERDFFETLMEVKGIGPKLALSLIGNISFQNLQIAISKKDTATLSKVPGVGKKTAERLVVELKDKIPSHFTVDFNLKTPEHSHSQKVRDAMSALINLGYNQGLAQKAIKKTLEEVSEESELPIIITNALKNI